MELQKIENVHVKKHWQFIWHRLDVTVQSVGSTINTFCQKIESLTTESEKLKKELKETFPEVFSAGLGRCKKMSTKFELKESIQPIF